MTMTMMTSMTTMTRMTTMTAMTTMIEILEEHDSILVLDSRLLSRNTPLQCDEVAVHHIEEVARLLPHCHTCLLCSAPRCIIHLNSKDGTCTLLKHAAALPLPEVDNIGSPSLPD